MRLFLATVAANDEIMPATHVLTLEVGRWARTTQPGQFVHIRCGDSGLLRRPMSVFRTEGDAIQLMVRAIGSGSEWLARSHPGDQLDCIGPLGRGFRLDPAARNLLLVGGGYGVAPLVGLGERALHQGANVALAVGAATASLVFPSRLLPEEFEYVVATDDGSLGHHGLVTDLVGERLGWADVVYACGPMPMMATMAEMVRQREPRKRAQAAMEEHMGCAMGVCLGCVIETRRGPMRVCTEGPVFDLQEIVWRENAHALGAAG